MQGCVAENGYTQQMQQTLAVGLWGPKAGGNPWGRQQMPVGRGGGRGLEQVKGQREWGEKGLLKQCWGQQDHACVSHICTFGLSPFRGQTTYVSRATSASDRDPAGCDAAVCLCNDREHSLLRGTDMPPGQGFGHPPCSGPHAPTPAPRPFLFPWGAAPPYLTSVHLPA